MTIRATLTLFFVIGGPVSFALCGCGNTASGIKSDAQADLQRTQDGASSLQRSGQRASRDFMASTSLTPKIVSAIGQDPTLGDPHNSIVPTSTATYVRLDGHVTTLKVKKHAGEVAEDAIKNAGATQVLENRLAVLP